MIVMKGGARALVVLFVAAALVAALPAAYAQSSLGCVRGNIVDLNPLSIVPGTGYQVTSGTDATVSVNELNSLGSGTYVYYDFTFSNTDSSSCGATSRWLIDVIGTGVNAQISNGNAYSQFSVVSAATSTGSQASFQTVTDGVTNQVIGYVVNAPVGQKVTVRVKAEVSSDLQSGVKGSGVITVTATNLDAQSEGVSRRVDGSSTITVGIVKQCVQKDPTISVSPALRGGFPGDQLDYLVTIKNENLGSCVPRTFTITQAGVQDLSQKLNNALVSNVPDSSASRYGITARFQSGGAVTERSFNSAGTGQDFTWNGNQYTRYTPSFSSLKFTLGSSDDLVTGSTSQCKTCIKNLILKVTSYKNEGGTGPRSIAICVDQGGICGFMGYEVLNSFQSKPGDTDASLGITDSLLNTPEATPSSGGGASSGGGSTGSSGGTTSSGGGTVSSGSTGSAAATMIVDPAFVAACKACADKPLTGFNTATKSCAEGFVEGSTFPGKALALVHDASSFDGKASIDNGNWIFYPTDAARDRLLSPSDVARRSKSYSCENPPAGVARISSASAGSATSGTTGSSTACTSCTSMPGKGYVTTTGKCESGTPVRSTESSASTSTGNWVFYQTETQINKVVAQHPEFSSAMSCDNLPSGGGTAANSAGGSGSATTCTGCTALPGKGYATDTGKCESGTPLKSSESSASVDNKNWVFYQTEALKSGIVATNPQYAGVYSCEKPP